MTRALRRIELARYSFFAAPLAMAALPIYVHVPKLYAEFGLPLGMLGALLLALRSLDALVDPLLGRWSDRLESRYAGCLIAALALLAGMTMLLNPAAAIVGLWPWLAVALLLVYAGFSLATIAYGAWGAELPPDSASRTTLTTSREAVGLAGVLVAAALPSALGSSNAIGLSRFAWVFAAALLTGLLLLRPIRLARNGAAAAAGSLSGAAGPAAAPDEPVLADRRFVALLAVFALNGIASAIPATLLLFFIEDVLAARDWEPLFLVGYFLAGALAMPMWAWLAVRLGKPGAWAVGMVTAIVAFGWAAALGSGDRLPFLVVCLASGVALGADLALPPSMLADTIAARHAGERAGRYFGIWTMVTKANLALAAGLALPMVGAFGYRAADPTSNLAALTQAYAVLPCLLKLLALALLLAIRNRLSIPDSPPSPPRQP